MTMNRFWIFTAFALAGLSGLLNPFFSRNELTQASLSPASTCELVVLADVDDPFYKLAREIAASEDAPLAGSLEEAIACRPVFLVWVVSPAFLSDEGMVAFGLAMKEQDQAISSGIITASTLEQARALWARSSQVGSERFVAINAANPAAHIDVGRITKFDGEEKSTQVLTRDGFLEALQSADYLTFTGHGGNDYLKLDEEVEINPPDIPSLHPVVVSTGSCLTFRPWNEASIALRFADQGAAVYTGFQFSPNEGYLLGEFDGLPLRYSWPDFPAGHIIQAQNRGIVQGFAQFPFQFLLGDPRVALQPEPPYELVEDRTEGNRRILKFRDVPSGVIPIRVENGAHYQYVEVPGLTAAGERDPFYNSRLQMVNIREDKFILLEYPGGDLTLRLRERAPWNWYPSDILLDSLDHTLIFAQQTGGDIISLAFSLLPLFWAVRMLWKKRLGWTELRLALVIGLVATLLQGAYGLLRLDQVTITSKEVVVSPLSLVAVFLLWACGVLIYLQARSWRGRLVALLVMTFSSWAPGMFTLLLLAALNTISFAPLLGTPVYNYSLGLITLGSFLFTLLLSTLALWYAGGYLRNGRKFYLWSSIGR